MDGRYHLMCTRRRRKRISLIDVTTPPLTHQGKVAIYIIFSEGKRATI
jgi:hypothetical protein